MFFFSTKRQVDRAYLPLTIDVFRSPLGGGRAQQNMSSFRRKYRTKILRLF